jgi:rhodanese-related sulfurtransferase
MAMKKTLLIVMLLLSTAAIQIAAGETKSIKPKDAHELIQQNEGNSDFVTLDVRTSGEYGDGHVEDAINIDFTAHTFKEQINMLDRSDTYVVYCAAGGFSARATEEMEEMGFDNLFLIKGGYARWERENLPVVR